MEVLLRADLVKIIPAKVEKLNVPVGVLKAAKSSRPKV
jgi:hypothetical protein